MTGKPKNAAGRTTALPLALIVLAAFLHVAPISRAASQIGKWLVADASAQTVDRRL